MVTRILLLLFTALFLSQCTEYKIDWSQCGTNTECFIRESCIVRTSPATDPAKLVRYTSGKLKDKCDAVLQIRAYSESKFHIMMQVDASDDPTHTIDDSGVSFKQEIVQFACSKNEGPTGNPALFKIDKLGDHKFEDKFVFCSFTLETIDKTRIRLKFPDNAYEPELTFTLGSPVSMIFGLPQDKFWNEIKTQCDPEMLTSVESTSDEFRQETIDVFAYPPFSCASQDYLLVTREDASTVLLTNGEALACDTEKWTLTRTSGHVTVPKTEKLNIVCAARFCSKCIPFAEVDRGDCRHGCRLTTPVDAPGNTGCKQHTCANSLDDFKVNDGRRFSAKSPIECKQKKEISDPNSKNSAWYFTPENAEPVEVAKASCLDTSFCWNNKKFNDGCPDEVPVADCKTVNKTANLEELFCPDGLRLLVTSGDKLSGAEWTKLKCDYLEGKYRDTYSEKILFDSDRENAFVGCAPRLPPTTPAPPVAASKITTEAIVGAASGAVLIAVIIGVVVFIVQRRRKAARIAAAAALIPETKKEPQKPDAEYKKTPQVSYLKRDPWLKRCRDRRKVLMPVNLEGRLTHGDFLHKILPDFTYFTFEQRRQVLYKVCSFDAYKAGNPEDMRFECDNGNFLQFWLLFREAEERNMDCMQSWEIMFRCVRQMWDYMETNGKLDYIDLDKRIKARMITFAKPILDELTWNVASREDPLDTQMRFFVVRVLLWADEESVITELTRQADLEIHQLEPPITAVVLQWKLRYMAQGPEFYKMYWESIILPDPRTYGPNEAQFGTLRQHFLYALCSTIDNSKKRNDDKFDLMLDVLEDIMDFKRKGKRFSPIDLYWAFFGVTSVHTNWNEGIWTFIEKTLETKKSLTEVREAQLDRLFPESKKAVKEPKEKEHERKVWKKATMETFYMVAELMNWNQVPKLTKVAEFYASYGIDNDSDQFKHDFLEKCLIKRVNNFEMRLVVDIKDKRYNKNGVRKGKEGLNAMFMKVLDDFEQSFRNFEMAHLDYKTPLQMLDVPSEKEEEKKKKELEAKMKFRMELEARCQALYDPDNLRKAEALKKAIEEAPKRSAEEQKKLEEEEAREKEAFLKICEDAEVPADCAIGILPKRDDKCGPGKEGAIPPTLPADWSEKRKQTVFKQPLDKTQEIDEGPGKAEEPKKVEEAPKKDEEKAAPKVEEKTQDDPSKSKSKSAPKSGPQSK